ncbi:MAG: hypothetical protein HUJ29_02495 [Gammaproteobacteria bacterium]|nr:hypothetical protein [Gammaproteobacteria bacterium]
MDIAITDKARQVLDDLVTPLHVEMELYFSCLIRKQVVYPPSPHPDAQTIDSGHPNLRLYFRPVMTKSCSVEESHGEPDLVPFPMQASDKFQPKWFQLDFRGGQWESTYGYSRNQ